MKTGILTLLLLTGVSANASWYQTHCASGDATVLWASGHNENLLTLTRMNSSEGPTTREQIQLAPDEFAIDIAHRQELSAESAMACEEGAETAVATWKNLSYQQVRITKQDGSLFDENISGVSADRSYVWADLICQEKGNSLVSCEATNENKD